MHVAILICLSLVSTHLYALIDFDREEIEQRIKPVGNVHVQAPASSSTTAPAPEKKQETPQKPGQATYEKYCITCHRDGVAGAPKFRDATDWQPRQAKQDINSLTATAIKGLNAMPAKGTCQECSEADIKAAIEYMVPQ